MSEGEKIRRMVDALEERLDAFQSFLLERYGDVSDEYDEVKRCYRLAAGIAVEFNRRDSRATNARRALTVVGDPSQPTSNSQRPLQSACDEIAQSHIRILKKD